MKRRTIQPRMRRRRKAKAVEYRAVAMKRMERKMHKLSRAIRAYGEALSGALKRWISTMQQLATTITEFGAAMRAMRQKQVEEAEMVEAPPIVANPKIQGEVRKGWTA